MVASVRPGPDFAATRISGREKGTYCGTRDGEQDGFAGRGSSAVKIPRVSTAVACRRSSRDVVLEPFDMSPLVRGVLPRAVRWR